MFLRHSSLFGRYSDPFEYESVFKTVLFSCKGIAPVFNFMVILYKGAAALFVDVEFAILVPLRRNAPSVSHYDSLGYLVHVVCHCGSFDTSAAKCRCRACGCLPTESAILFNVSRSMALASHF